MLLEIERKWLVAGDPGISEDGMHITQGYLHKNGTTTRVRIIDHRQAFFCVKGKTVGKFSKPEYEWSMPIKYAQDMIANECGGRVLEKIRRRHKFQGRVWEVDKFLGPLSGLLVAECEVESEDDTVIVPEWCTHEVTLDKRYKNRRLAVSKRIPNKGRKP